MNNFFYILRNLKTRIINSHTLWLLQNGNIKSYNNIKLFLYQKILVVFLIDLWIFFFIATIFGNIIL